MAEQNFTELIPGLPEEIAIECLIKVHYSAHETASRVSKRWLNLLRSKEFYYQRKQSGKTQKSACLIQGTTVPSESKSVGWPIYGLSVFDPVSLSWDRVDPPPRYKSGLPLFCQIASTEGKLFIIGGWDPSNWDPVKDVFVYEFTTRRWTRCADMPSTRSFFAVGAIEGKIFVAGGHDESKNALKSGWVLDLKANKWSELGEMSEERDECEGIVMGNEFWVVSGYDTENQGEFKSSVEIYDMGSGEWKRVEDAWRVSMCPRSCVGVGESGKLRCWSECDAAARVGVCGVGVGDTAVVIGSGYQGGPHGFFVEGQNGKFERVDVPYEFCGFVQSGCSVEI